jgi:hypothetical protein
MIPVATWLTASVTSSKRYRKGKVIDIKLNDV